ncbi:uncharacterized protein LOC135484135 [Lineus longissimus]|uniref:uncharacterized protein LOC135484135 n=1 Tax=Lineus longissimus TaxID=88925 RepID=UPI00315DF2AB
MESKVSSSRRRSSGPTGMHIMNNRLSKKPGSEEQPKELRRSSSTPHVNGVEKRRTSVSTLTITDVEQASLSEDSLEPQTSLKFTNRSSTETLETVVNATPPIVIEVEDYCSSDDVAITETDLVRGSTQTNVQAIRPMFQNGKVRTECMEGDSGYASATLAVQPISHTKGTPFEFAPNQDKPDQGKAVLEKLNGKCSLGHLVDAFNRSPGAAVLTGEYKSRFVELLCSDDVTSVKYIYDNLSETAKTYFHLCIIGGFENFKLSNRCSEYSADIVHRTHFKRAPVLSALFGSLTVFNFYLETSKGKDIIEMEENGNHNILHALILGSFLKIRPEQRYVMVYVKAMEWYDEGYQRRALLHCETDGGFRPLELASKLGQYKLTLEILETEKVYKMKVDNFGPHLHIEYNVSEYYTTGSRRDKSLIRDLVRIREDRLPALRDSNLMYHPLIKAWRRTTYWASLPTISIWFLYRIAFVVLVFSPNLTNADALFLYYDYILATNDINLSFVLSGISTNLTIIQNEMKNFTAVRFIGNKEVVSCLTSHIRRFMWGSANSTDRPDWGNLELVMQSTQPLLIIAVLSVILDLVDFAITSLSRLRKGKLANYSEGSGTRVIDTKFFRITHFIMIVGYGIFTAVAEIISAFLRKGGVGIGFVHVTPLIHFSTVAYAVAKVLTIWSLLYFIQLFPGLGKFVIGFQRMIMALTQFALVLFMIFISFSLTLTSVLRLDCDKPEFQNHLRGMYSTFLIILNMVDLSKFNVQTAYVVALLHVAFIMIVTILLINFLIALMSNKHSDMNQYGDLIHKLCCLGVAETASRKVTMLLCCKRRKRSDRDVIVVTRIRRPKEFSHFLGGVWSGE